MKTECYGCPDRTATCHASCKIHLEAWKKRRERDNELVKQGDITNYTVREVIKTKRGYKSLKTCRPKGKDG